jgi:hypothetical protein
MLRTISWASILHFAAAGLPREPMGRAFMYCIADHHFPPLDTLSAGNGWLVKLSVDYQANPSDVALFPREQLSPASTSVAFQRVPERPDEVDLSDLSVSL